MVQTVGPSEAATTHGSCRHISTFIQLFIIEVRTFSFEKSCTRTTRGRNRVL